MVIKKYPVQWQFGDLELERLRAEVKRLRAILSAAGMCRHCGSDEWKTSHPARCAKCGAEERDEP